MKDQHKACLITHILSLYSLSRSLARLALFSICAIGITSVPRVNAQSNGPTVIQIAPAGGNVNLNWNSGGTLQSAPSALGPWTNYSGNVSVASSSTTLINGGARFFRVVNNGVASAPVAIFSNSLTAPLQVQSASLQYLGGSANSNGNTRLVVTVPTNTVSPSNIITLLVNDNVTLLRDDGQFPDQVAGDGNFSASINVATSDLQAWNVALSNLPPPARISYVYSGRQIVGTNQMQPIPINTFTAGGAIPFIGGTVGPFFGPCTGSPLAYDPAKTVMITALSVVGDTNRTWDNNGPPTAFGVGGVGKKMGAWTFGKLMTDMANVGSPGNTVSSASDFVLRTLRSFDFQQTINNDTAPAVPNIEAEVIQPWLAASQAEGLPTNTLDLAIAPFRLLAIVNRVDLRGNSTYGSTTGNPCVPEELAGEARFVFGFIDPNSQAGSPYQNTASNQLTLILEYAVPISDCVQVQNWGAQWAALNNISFTTPAVNPAPFTSDLKFNQALQAITDKFAKAGANPNQMPNKSAIAQVRVNEFLGPQWELRQFNINTATGYLVESTVAATPAFPYNATPTLEAFLATLNNASFCNGGPLVATPAIPIPTMFQGNSFLGGWAPEGVPISSNLTSGMFWIGTDCAQPCARHVLSLNACNGCHTQETGTSFTHITPRAFGVQANLSGFLTGTTITDPSGCTTDTYSYSDLQRRVQDLNALVTCGCNAEVAHIVLRMSH